jgi:trehalose-6-phosphatase
VVVTVNEKVAIVTLNRSQALNALCEELAVELLELLNRLDQDDSVHVIIITGNSKAFAGTICKFYSLAFSCLFLLEILHLRRVLTFNYNQFSSIQFNWVQF